MAALDNARDELKELCRRTDDYLGRVKLKKSPPPWEKDKEIMHIVSGLQSKKRAVVECSCECLLLLAQNGLLPSDVGSSTDDYWHFREFIADALLSASFSVDDRMVPHVVSSVVKLVGSGCLVATVLGKSGLQDPQNHAVTKVLCDRPDHWPEVASATCESIREYGVVATRNLWPMCAYILLEPEPPYQRRQFKDFLFRELIRVAWSDKSIEADLVPRLVAVIHTLPTASPTDSAFFHQIFADVASTFVASSPLDPSSTLITLVMKRMQMCCERLERGVSYLNDIRAVTSVLNMAQSMVMKKPEMVSMKVPSVVLVTAACLCLKAESQEEQEASMTVVRQLLSEGGDEGSVCDAKSVCPLLVIVFLQLRTTPCSTVKDHAAKLLRYVETMWYNGACGIRESVSDVEWPGLTGLMYQCDEAMRLLSLVTCAESAHHKFLDARISEGGETMSEPSLPMALHMLALILSESDDLREKAATVFRHTMGNHIAIAKMFLPVVLYRLALETVPKIQMSLLSCLPAAAKNPDCVGPVLRTIATLVPGGGRATALAVRLQFMVWENQPRTFPRLEEMVEKHHNSDNIDVQISVASCIHGICKRSPDKGEDFIGILSGLVCRSDNHVSVSLGLYAMNFLCQADVLDMFAAWGVISGRMETISHPQVRAAVVDLFVTGAKAASAAVAAATTKVPGDESQGDGNDSGSSDEEEDPVEQRRMALQYIWDSLQSGCKEVQKAALRGLTQLAASDIEEFVTEREGFVDMIMKMSTHEESKGMISRILAQENSVKVRHLVTDVTPFQSSSLQKAFRSLAHSVVNHKPVSAAERRNLLVSRLYMFEPKQPADLKKGSALGRRHKVYYSEEYSLCMDDVLSDMSLGDWMENTAAIVFWPSFARRYFRCKVDGEIASQSLAGRTIGEDQATEEVFSDIMRTIGGHCDSFSRPQMAANACMALGCIAASLPPSSEGDTALVVSKLLDIAKGQGTPLKIKGSALAAVGMACGSLNIADMQRVEDISTLVLNVCKEHVEDIEVCSGGAIALGYMAHTICRSTPVVESSEKDSSSSRWILQDIRAQWLRKTVLKLLGMLMGVTPEEAERISCGETPAPALPLGMSGQWSGMGVSIGLNICCLALNMACEYDAIALVTNSLRSAAKSATPESLGAVYLPLSAYVTSAATLGIVSPDEVAPVVLESLRALEKVGDSAKSAILVALGSMLHDCTEKGIGLTHDGARLGPRILAVLHTFHAEPMDSVVRGGAAIGIAAMAGAQLLGPLRTGLATGTSSNLSYLTNMSEREIDFADVLKSLLDTTAGQLSDSSSCKVAPILVSVLAQIFNEGASGDRETASISLQSIPEGSLTRGVCEQLTTYSRTPELVDSWNSHAQLLISELARVEFLPPIGWAAIAMRLLRMDNTPMNVSVLSLVFGYACRADKRDGIHELVSELVEESVFFTLDPGPQNVTLISQPLLYKSLSLHRLKTVMPKLGDAIVRRADNSGDTSMVEALFAGLRSVLCATDVPDAAKWIARDVAKQTLMVMPSILDREGINKNRMVILESLSRNVLSALTANERAEWLAIHNDLSFDASCKMAVVLSLTSAALPDGSVEILELLKTARHFVLTTDCGTKVAPFVHWLARPASRMKPGAHVEYLLDSLDMAAACPSINVAVAYVAGVCYWAPTGTSDMVSSINSPPSASMVMNALPCSLRRVMGSSPWNHHYVDLVPKLSALLKRSSQERSSDQTVLGETFCAVREHVFRVAQSWSIMTKISDISTISVMDL